MAERAPTSDRAPPIDRGQRRWWVPAAVVVVLAAAVLPFVLRRPHRPAISRDEVNAIVNDKLGKAVSDIQAAPAPGVPVYDAIRPPLVVVQGDRPRGAGGKPTGSDLGAGVIVNDQGAILTALHVVQDSAGIRVEFADGTESPATVQSSDPDHDIAVLSAERLPQTIVPAVLGGGVQIGDDVYAVGHPLGLLGSLSAGVVSGTDRSFPLASGKTLTGLIQFDAAVNPGNSGGPLLNRKGQVIGIVTGLANPAGDGDFVGIGFAVPIGTAGGAAGAPAR
jgi:S1-C subfamily serine protease